MTFSEKESPSSLEQKRKGNYTYNVRCFQKEKELPILLNNPQINKVVISKGPICHTLEDIQIEPNKKFTVVDNRVFIDHLMTSDTDWKQVFHVSENYISPIIEHKPDTSHLDQRKKIEKNTKKRRRDQDFKENYELETDSSDDLKNLKPQFESLDSLRPIKFEPFMLKQF